MNQTAQGLASLGRGPDSMLVHMAPGEVKSLQQLAMAHGGSLTINPETGLPEAGFLSSLLPMLIGGGLTIASGGALTPVMAGLITGGGYGLATGSLKKGLMAGFGAYGGAGLGSALAGAGASAGAAGAAGADAIGAGSASIAEQTAINAAKGINPDMFGSAAANFKNAGAGVEGLLTSQGRDAFLGNAASKGVAATGIGGLKGLGMAGLAAAAPMLMETTTKQPEIKSDANMGQRYQFNAGTQTPTPTPDVPGYGDQGRNFGREQRYFNPTYTPIDNEAARKLHGYAYGGPVEDMSNGNDMAAYMGQDKFAGGGSINLQGTFDIGGGQGGGQMGGSNNPQPFVGNNNAPSMMPAAMQQTLPFRGTPQPDVMPGGLQGLLKGPMSQGMAFAEGGEVGGYTYDPVTQMYVKKSGEGATMVSPTGGISGASGSSGSDQYTDPNPGWSGLTDREKASYYAANPTMAAITQALQAGFGLTSLGMAQNYFSPDTVNTASLNAQGFDRGGNFLAEPSGMPGPQNQTSYESGVGNPGEGDGGFTNDAGGSEPSGSLGFARGGISHLGDYSDGGRLLRGPGDGISDSIPAMIGKKQPARLADGEFVVPARIVSELGNGSTEAGARKLYAMMDRIQKARGKTIGKGKVAANSRSAKYLPA